LDLAETVKLAIIPCSFPPWAAGMESKKAGYAQLTGQKGTCLEYNFICFNTDTIK